MQVIFAGDRKDSLRNIEQTGVFATNVVSEPLWHQMNATSARLPYGTDEFTHAGVKVRMPHHQLPPRVPLPRHP